MTEENQEQEQQHIERTPFVKIIENLIRTNDKAKLLIGYRYDNGQLKAIIKQGDVDTSTDNYLLLGFIREAEQQIVDENKQLIVERVKKIIHDETESIKQLLDEG